MFQTSSWWVTCTSLAELFTSQLALCPALSPVSLAHQCAGQAVQDVAQKLPFCFCLLMGSYRTGSLECAASLKCMVGACSGIWRCLGLASLRCINLCFILSLCLSFPFRTLPPNDAKSQPRVERSTEGVGLPTGVERERGSRKPRRYFSPGESRKTSERFRTQPITSAERKESDR